MQPVCTGSAELHAAPEEIYLAVRERTSLGVERRPFSLYVSKDRHISASPKCGMARNRVMVCSLPKAGTYLVSAFLAAMGMEDVHLHLDDTFLTDYRYASREQARSDYKQLRRNIPLQTIIDFILPGQFAVGHLPCTPIIADLLEDFRIIFAYRNLRDGLISFMRWEQFAGRDHERTKDWISLTDSPAKVMVFMEDLGKMYLQWCSALIGWTASPNVYKCSFEEILGDKGQDTQVACLHDIFVHSGMEGNEPDWHEIVHEVVGSETMTWSGVRTVRENYWDDNVEAAFREAGGAELNRLLGNEE